MEPKFNQRREEYDTSYLFDESPEVRKVNIVKNQNKGFKKLKLIWNLKKIKGVEKLIDKDLLKYYDLISYESASFINELTTDKNYLQFLIKLTEYLKEMKKDIYIYTLQSISDKYNQNDKINIDLSYFLDKFFNNKEDFYFDLNFVYKEYLERIYREF